MMSDNNIIIILIVVGFIVIFVAAKKLTECTECSECFRANHMETDILDVTYDSLKDDMITPHTHHHVKNYLSNRVFIGMVHEIRRIIINKLVQYGKICQNMHGDEVKLADGKQALSLACQNNPWEIEESIIMNIVEYLRSFIQNKFNINLNPYIVIHDLMRHLNLLEGVIYPLQFSGLYTVHGVQYMNENIVTQMVNTNLDVKNVLLSILGRRGITLLVDTDQHI